MQSALQTVRSALLKVWLLEECMRPQATRAGAGDGRFGCAKTWLVVLLAPSIIQTASRIANHPRSGALIGRLNDRQLRLGCVLGAL
jgi:hypothetical protein